MLASLALTLLHAGAMFVGSPADGASYGARLQAADTAVVLHGLVRAPGYRGDGSVPGALLWVRQGEQVRMGMSDGAGRYRLEGLTGGEALLSVSHIATEGLHLTVVLPSSGALALDLELETRVFTLAPLSVQGIVLPAIWRAGDPIPRTAPARATLAFRSLESTSGVVESGLTAFASRSNPDAGEPDRDRVLFTRGSTVDARAVFLDGAPILTPFHIAGLLPAFDGSLLSAAEMHVGGAPARHDGGLSYLLDLSTRSAREGRLQMEGAADGVTLRGSLEAGGSRGGIIAGGRFLHGLQENLMGPEAFPYEYGDVLVRGDLRPAEGHALRATGYLNREGVLLDLNPSGGSADPSSDGARWGNRALSLGYLLDASGFTLDATAAASHYHSAVPLNWPEPLVAGGTSDRLRGAMELRRSTGQGEMRFGGSAERMDLEYTLTPRATLSSASILSPRERIRSSSAGVLGEWEGEVVEGTRLRAGLRGDRYFEANQTVLGPRAELALLISERAVLTLSAGRHHQAVPTTAIDAEFPEEGNSTFRWDPGVDIAAATHLVVALSQEFAPATRLDLNGFMRRYGGRDGNPFQGLRASGSELRLLRTGDRLDGWFGYALTWFWEEEGIGGNNRFEGRQLLSAGAQVALTPITALGITVGFGSGLPLSAVDVTVAEPTAPPGLGNRSPVRMDGSPVRSITSASEGLPLDIAQQDDFLRLDLELSWDLEPTWGGRSTHLRPYIRVLNALDRRDALFHYFDRWRSDEMQPLASRPLLPLVGVEWRF